jgi:hypothetical protein
VGLPLPAPLRYDEPVEEWGEPCRALVRRRVERLPVPVTMRWESVPVTMRWESVPVTVTLRSESVLAPLPQGVARRVEAARHAEPLGEPPALGCWHHRANEPVPPLSPPSSEQ